MAEPAAEPSDNEAPSSGTSLEKIPEKISLMPIMMINIPSDDNRDESAVNHPLNQEMLE